MAPAVISTPRYDHRTIALHWIIALIIPLQWANAHVIDWFPKGPYRVDARSLHILLGALLALALVYRLYWRATKGVRFPVDTAAPLEVLAKVVHYLLYALLGAVLLLGIFNTWLRGDDIFGLFHIPKFGSYDKDARHLFANEVVDWHRLTSTALLILGGSHALVALFHLYGLKDAVLRRMLPR